jgi:hypothetical protein
MYHLRKDILKDNSRWPLAILHILDLFVFKVVHIINSKAKDQISTSK